MLLKYFFYCVCEVKEDVYNEVDFQLVMLAKIKALSKQIATSTRVPKNANLVIALQYDLRGKAHANDHCVPEGYVEQTHCVGNYQDSDSYFDIDNPWWYDHSNFNWSNNQCQNFIQ